MSNLPGNPHHDVADSMKREYGLPHDKEALNWPLVEIGEHLASIAYEQRTANLIAVATAVTGDGVHLLDPDIVQSAQWELYERLGIEASK